jgi:tetratricopeptide (TPR) repeat protein
MAFMWDQIQHILFGNLFRTLRTLFLAVAVLHVLYFMVAPRLLIRRKTRSTRWRRYLEFVVLTPSLLGDLIRVEARHRLMRLAHMEGRHAQAAEQGFAIVRHRHLPAGFVAEVRGRLADALEGLGRLDEAQEQRQCAKADLAQAPRDAAWYVNQGRQLAATRNFAGACEAYEMGLRLPEPVSGRGRELLTLHLANALFMCGRLEDSARRAEEAVELVQDPQLKLTAHRQAGAALADLGRLDEAEAHKRRCAELAESLGDPVRLADCLGDLASMQRKRGHLAQALAGCKKAEASSRPTRHTEMIRYEILRSWGRFDEALAALKRATELDPNPTRRAEQMMQGLFSFCRAFVLLEQDSLDEVPALLDAARAQVQGDAKVTLWCDASGVRLLARQGHREVVLDALDSLESRLSAFAQDNNTRGGVLANLGRAAQAIDEYQRALNYWQQYLDLPPQPVDLPIAHYQIGEAHRGLGDQSAANASYLAAVNTGLDTHYVHLAQARLRSILT